MEPAMKPEDAVPPADLYPSHLETLRHRFDRALERAGYESVLIGSGPLSPWYRDDQTYPFKAYPWFKAWIPLTDVPDCFIHYTPGQRPSLLFHQPIDYWYKPPSAPQGYWTSHFEIRPVPDQTAARSALPQYLGSTAYLGPPFPELTEWGLKCVNPPDLLRRVDYERASKTPYEIACLREASRLGARGHAAAAKAFASGASEFDIQLAFLDACGLREQELPYNTIIALNEAAAVLHYQVLERRAPAERHSLLIDAGAESAGYASDITRTHAFADSDFAALIASFDDVQQSLCASVHAGIDWRDVHLSAHRLVAELLHEADITTCDAEEAVDTGVSSVFLPHGIGHLLGLQVHDVGGFMRTAESGEIPQPEGHPYLRLTRILEPGFVVTMEPGIYFIDQLLEPARHDSRASRINWARVASLHKFGGIRIEDDLAVTATGAENLTRDAFSVIATGALA
jgi:Xaa-Pro dipeptidase